MSLVWLFLTVFLLAKTLLIAFFLFPVSFEESNCSFDWLLLSFSLTRAMICLTFCHLCDLDSFCPWSFLLIFLSHQDFSDEQAQPWPARHSCPLIQWGCECIWRSFKDFMIFLLHLRFQCTWSRCVRHAGSHSAFLTFCSGDPCANFPYLSYDHFCF